VTLIRVLLGLGPLLMFYGAMGYLDARDPDIREKAKKPGWPRYEAPTDPDPATENPFAGADYARDVLMVRHRRRLVILGAICALVGVIELWVDG
jgi:hypothetical protein